MTAATTATEAAKKNPEKEILTYSALAKFRNCRRSYKHRYVDELRSVGKSEALWVGAAFHDALHVLAIERLTGKTVEASLAAALGWLDRGPLLGAASDPARRSQRDLLRAMVRNYVARWKAYRPPELGVDPLDDRNLEEVATEYSFVVPIRNPETGATSRTFVLAGKVDGVVRIEGRLFIKETKTASTIDGDYLSKLWADFQSQIYAAALSRVFKEPVVGVLYDVTAKSRLSRKGGETQAEFEERLASYKTEKTREKHLLAGPKREETEEEIAARLDEWYAQPDAFIRQLIYFDVETLANVEAEVWELTQQILDAHRREKFGQNTTQCYAFGACPYAPICRNHGRLDETVSGFFEKVPAHEELRDVLPEGYATKSLLDSLDEIDAAASAQTPQAPAPSVPKYDAGGSLPF